jgi:hypothetical protein
MFRQSDQLRVEVINGVAKSSVVLTQPRLEYRPVVLNRVEVRRVCGEKPLMTFGIFDQSLGLVRLVKRGIVEENGLLWLKQWHEMLLEPSIEKTGVGVPRKTASGQ